MATCGAWLPDGRGQGGDHAASMEPGEQFEVVAWCQCCRDADCPHHMGQVEAAVECVVCGEACQCVGCAANVAPLDD